MKYVLYIRSLYTQSSFLTKKIPTEISKYLFFKSNCLCSNKEKHGKNLEH